MSQAEGDALNTEKRSLKAMQSQLDILRQDQTQMQEQRTLLAAQLDNMRTQTDVLKKQWERQNQTPSLLVLVGSNVLQPASELFLDIPKDRAFPRLKLALSLRNVGNATIRRPKLRPDVEPAPVKADCVFDRAFMANPDNPCPYDNPELPDIAPDTDQNTNQQHASKPSDLNLIVAFSLPSGTNEFTVHYTIYADNLSSAVYSLHITIR